ncbi:MAG: quinone-dependent dihydroorotate dehydrogenase, partial [Nitrospinae bacterium]|nr:quinone-dependent dihydroorotate dehydrogenase [Nitrospinota bacterium]
MFYRWLARPLLFRLDPERAHHLTLWLLQQVGRMHPLQALLRRSLYVEHPMLRTRVCGLDFSNPVGLAAGFDKGGTAVTGLAALGFGFIEVGTVTPRPQPGNPLPRLFRLPAEQAVINRMGFNSDGAEAVGKRLGAGGWRIQTGVNLGKNAATHLEHALDDYRRGLEHLYDLGDYFVINVSSPNTPGLRDLQESSRLNDLLTGVQASNRALAGARGMRPKPLFVKIAPDLEPKELDGVIEVVQTVPLDGIIATNTTVGRGGLSAQTTEAGGLSGIPLRQRATEVVHYLFKQSEGRIPIIGVGGIFSVEDAYEKICAGASLVQVYTGLI